MAATHPPAAVHNSYYYDTRLTPYYLHHHYQNAAIFGYVLIYSQYWVPTFLQYQQPQPYVGSTFNHHNVINHQYITPCDESWILNAQQQEEDEEDEEIVLNEEELREWDLLDEELVIYDSGDDDDGLSDETITKHLKTTRDHHHHHHVDADDQICVVCQDCLFQEDHQEKFATLDCGHDFHVGCIKNWLMLKNCCPLCKATGIRL